MIVLKVNSKEFFEAVDNATYQNQDILEAMEFGYKGVQDAYRQAELPWARFYLVYNGKKLLASILEQRDGVLFVYTTTKLPGSNIRVFVKKLKHLLDNTVKCKDVVYTTHVRWHEPGKKLLKLLGFYEHKIYNHRSIWVKEYGK